MIKLVSHATVSTEMSVTIEQGRFQTRKCAQSWIVRYKILPLEVYVGVQNRGMRE